ncbi:MAG: hypothetical protein ACK56F_23185, partial [bacterium]
YKFEISNLLSLRTFLEHFKWKQLCAVDKTGSCWPVKISHLNVQNTCVGISINVNWHSFVFCVGSS